jgi:hypothetical protein
MSSFDNEGNRNPYIGAASSSAWPIGAVHLFPPTSVLFAPFCSSPPISSQDVKEAIPYNVSIIQI